jgi:hypothetical protein
MVQMQSPSSDHFATRHGAWKILLIPPSAIRTGCNCKKSMHTEKPPPRSPGRAGVIPVVWRNARRAAEHGFEMPPRSAEATRQSSSSSSSPSLSTNKTRADSRHTVGPHRRLPRAAGGGYLPRFGSRVDSYGRSCRRPPSLKGCSN